VEEVKLMIEEMLGKVINVKSLAKALTGCEWQFKRRGLRWAMKDYEESEDVVPRIIIRKEITTNVLNCNDNIIEIDMLQISVEIDYDVYIIPLKILSSF